MENTKIAFRNHNGFDSFFLNSFNGIEASGINLEKLRSKIDSLYFNDPTVDYSTKGITWTLIDFSNGSSLDISVK